MNIFVSQRVIKISKINESRDCLDQRITKILNYCNINPIFIPNNLIQKEDNMKLIKFLKSFNSKGLLLTGGDNFGDFKDRDKTEFATISYSIKKEIPILGICRGMQMIAKFFGKNLKKINKHVGKKHEIQSLIHKNKFPKKVNSYHNFTISSCPSDFDVAAKAMDGSIEAIKHRFLKIDGWMWHPERENPFIQEDIKNIKKIFNV